MCKEQVVLQHCSTYYKQQIKTKSEIFDSFANDNKEQAVAIIIDLKSAYNSL